MKFGQHYLSEHSAFNVFAGYVGKLIYDSIDFQVSEVFCKGSEF